METHRPTNKHAVYSRSTVLPLRGTYKAGGSQVLDAVNCIIATLHAVIRCFQYFVIELNRLIAVFRYVKTRRWSWGG